MCRNGCRRSLICDADRANRAIAAGAVFMDFALAIMVAGAIFDSRSRETVKRRSGLVLPALAMLALPACEEEKEQAAAVARTERGLEQSLMVPGCAPWTRMRPRRCSTNRRSMRPMP